ncbi:carbohydrate sulfotransferase 1-like [Diadema antillarum]|uniref:carbohydrate sulfotransferase 1-like n=1 Tax=Diadema antillarum TaxID=105358 RepID=UPI003A8B9C38
MSLAFAIFTMFYIARDFLFTKRGPLDFREVSGTAADKFGKRDSTAPPLREVEVNKTGEKASDERYNVNLDNVGNGDHLNSSENYPWKDDPGVGDVNDISGEQKTEENPPFIVILAQWRFGSTIVGEIFNQNQNIFFLFEPLWLVDALRRKNRLPKDFTSPEVHSYTTQTLREIAGCNFTSEFVSLSNSWGGTSKNRAICEVANPTTDCKVPNPQWVRNLCSQFKGRIAVKLIRADLDDLRSLVEDSETNVKVIHLVRDPRGAAASRIHYYFEVYPDLVNRQRPQFATLGRLAPLGLNNITERPKDCIPNMCGWIRRNFRSSANVPDWLRSRYYLLRYEDFAEAPVQVAQDLYKFVGLPFPASVKSWIVDNTKVENSEKGTFDVKKNSRAIASQWMSDLSQVEIEQVEADCLDVMDDLGYKRYAVLTS